MQIKDEYPPNIEKIKKVFSVETTTVYTYGDVIHAPGIKFMLPLDLIEHESIHSLQQKAYGSPDKWWDRYLEDEAFRLDQEVQAYKAQYKLFADACKSRQKRFEFLVVIARDLSSKLYGNICDFYTACRLIKE